MSSAAVMIGALRVKSDEIFFDTVFTLNIGTSVGNRTGKSQSIIGKVKLIQIIGYTIGYPITGVK